MFKLGSLLVLVLALVACTPNTSTVGQRITCTVDPDSGTIASCEEGEGDGGANTCQDIDEDGDGQPEDETDDGSGTPPGGGGDGTLTFTDPGSGSDGSGDSDDSADDCDEDEDGLEDTDDPDDDNDGIDDADDCDETEGGDSDSADLPYDVKMSLGQSYTPIVDAFAEKGAQPASIVSVEMDGGGSSWRLTELQSGATFVVTDADCAHVGNRDVGRDRVIVTWLNADGTQESDHLDLRYCEE